MSEAIGPEGPRFQPFEDNVIRRVFNHILLSETEKPLKLIELLGLLAPQGHTKNEVVAAVFCMQKSEGVKIDAVTTELTFHHNWPLN